MLPARSKPIQAVGDVLMIDWQKHSGPIVRANWVDDVLSSRHRRRTCGPDRSAVRGLRALQGPTIRRRVAGLERHATRLAIARRVAWPAVD